MAQQDRKRAVHRVIERDPVFSSQRKNHMLIITNTTQNCRKLSRMETVASVVEIQSFHYLPFGCSHNLRFCFHCPIILSINNIRWFLQSSPIHRCSRSKWNVWCFFYVFISHSLIFICYNTLFHLSIYNIDINLAILLSVP